MKKYPCVFLIDDDHTTNVYHSIIIKRSNLTDRIITMENPVIALDELQRAANQQSMIPELIFLDVNMPRMNGLEFLQEYKKIHEKLSSKPVVYMLTASLGSDEESAFLSFDFVKKILRKPLTLEVLTEVLGK